MKRNSTNSYERFKNTLWNKISDPRHPTQKKTMIRFAILSVQLLSQNFLNHFHAPFDTNKALLQALIGITELVGIEAKQV
jgi:hypothetical protein